MEKHKYISCSQEDFKKSYIYEVIKNPFKLRIMLSKKYGDIEEDFNLLFLDSILYSKNCHFAVKYRDYLIWDYVDEFLKRFYNCKESRERLPRIANYYKNYLQFFCSPFFKDFETNEIIQIYGDDKAKVYYKSNYGNKGNCVLGDKNNDFINNNDLYNCDNKENKEIGEEKNNKKHIQENEKNNKKEINENENEEDCKSMIFNTSVICNIENNVITRSSLNTKNEASKNYDSFFHTSFSKINILESKKNFLNFSYVKNTDEINLITNNKNNNGKKKFKQESFVNLLNDVNANSSFTYYLMTEENSVINKSSKFKDNFFDVKTGFALANKIKAKAQQKNLLEADKPKINNNNNNNNKNNLNFDNETKNESNFTNQRSESKISSINNNNKLNVKNFENKSNFEILNPNQNNNNQNNNKTPSSKSNQVLAISINSNIQSIKTNNNSNKSTNVRKSPKLISNINTQNSLINLHNEAKMLYYKNQINEQSKIFKQMYNEVIKESTNKLFEKQNILSSNLNKTNAKKNNQNVLDNANSNSNKKGLSKDKEKKNVDLILNAKEKEKYAKTVEIDLKTFINKNKNIESIVNVNTNIKTHNLIERGSSSISNLESKINRKPSSVSNEKENEKFKNQLTSNKIENGSNNKSNKIQSKNKLFSVHNATNNFNIEGNNNFVINITPALNMDLGQLQSKENFNRKIDISPERIILHKTSNRVGTPTMNSIVNINFQPILQLKSNQPSINIFSSNEETNNIKEQVVSNAIKSNLNQAVETKKANNHAKLMLNPPNKTNIHNLNELKTRFSEFKNNKISNQNKPTGRYSSVSNNSNKSKEIPKKFSYFTSHKNNLVTQLKKGKSNNYSLSKQLISSSNKTNYKNNNYNDYNNKSNNKSISQNEINSKSKKSNLDAEMQSKSKTKSFEQNDVQGNFIFNFKTNNKINNINNFIDENKIVNGGLNSKNVKFSKNINDSYGSKNEFLISDCGRKSNLENKTNKENSSISRNYITEIKKLCFAKNIIINNHNNFLNKESKKISLIRKNNSNNNKNNDNSNENFNNFANKLNNKLLTNIFDNKKGFENQPSNCLSVKDRNFSSEAKTVKAENEIEKLEKHRIFSTELKNHNYTLRREAEKTEKDQIATKIYLKKNENADLKIAEAGNFNNPIAGKAREIKANQHLNFLNYNRFSSEFSSKNNNNVSNGVKINSAHFLFSTLNKNQIKITKSIDNYFNNSNDKNNNNNCIENILSKNHSGKISPLNFNTNKNQNENFKIPKKVNISNTKLSNYLINSSNLASLNSPHNSTNLFSNNSSAVNIKSTTLNSKTNNNNMNFSTIKNTKSLNYGNNNNKIESAFKNFNMEKILSNMTKGNSLSIKNSNNKSTNAHRLFTAFNTNSNNDHANNNIVNNNHSSSPIKNKSLNFSFINKNLKINQSRNKQSEINKLNTNTSKNNKNTKRNFYTEDNQSINQPQSIHIKNENPNAILNTKLFDFLKKS